jgi:centromere protein I
MDDAPTDRHSGFKVLRLGSRRNKASVIPDVHTFHATEVGTNNSTYYS